MLDYGLVRHSEGRSYHIRPVCGIMDEVWTMQGATSASQGQEARCIEVWEEEEEYVNWQVKYVHPALRVGR
jgi:hypothetical protein